MEERFSQWKSQSANKRDQSKKGAVDAEIEHVVSLLNSCEQFFTSSSCSGRVILIDGAPDGSHVQKQNCVWLFVSHQKCNSEDLLSSLAKSTGDAVMKFEPFVLHIQCRHLSDGQLLHTVAVNSGFRNSGLTISKTGRIVMAVRSTHGLEVPLSYKGKLLVGHDYISFLTQTANQKMEENLKRIDRFFHNLQSALQTKKEYLQTPDCPVSQERRASPHKLNTAEKEENETAMYQRRRRQQQDHQTHCCQGNEPISVTDLDDCLDLFT